MNDISRRHLLLGTLLVSSSNAAPLTSGPAGSELAQSSSTSNDVLPNLGHVFRGVFASGIEITHNYEVLRFETGLYRCVSPLPHTTDSNSPGSDSGKWQRISNIDLLTFSSVSSMADASWLLEGDVVNTQDRNGLGLGGGGKYLITADGVANGFDKLQLQNDLVAVLQPDSDGFVNSLQFGAVDDCSSTYYFGVEPSGTDSTAALKAMFESGNYKRCRLGRSRGGSGVYLVADTLTPTPMFIDGAKCIIHGDWVDQSKSIVVCKKQNGQIWSSFTLRGSSYMPQAGIEFKKPDNQAMTLQNVAAQNCRYGAYLAEGECVNRLRIINCNFHGLFGGIHFDSFARTNAYDQSAPIFIEDTIINGCGLPQKSNWWNENTARYKGVKVIKSSDPRYGRSLYLRGFNNVLWRGGQISDHSENRLLNHICCERVNAITFTDPDLEIVRTPVDMHGKDIVDANTEELLDAFDEEDVFSGCVSVFSDCTLVKFSVPHTWALKNQVFLRLVNSAQGSEINLPHADNIECKYLFDALPVAADRRAAVKVNNLSRCSTRSFKHIHASSMISTLHLGSLTGACIKPSANSDGRAFSHFDQGTLAHGKADNERFYALVNAQYAPFEDPLAVQTEGPKRVPCSVTYPSLGIKKVLLKCLLIKRSFTGSIVAVLSFYDSADRYLSHVERQLIPDTYISEGEVSDIYLQAEQPRKSSYFKLGFVCREQNKAVDAELSMIPVNGELVAATVFDISESSSLVMGVQRSLIY